MAFREPLPMECKIPSWMQGERFVYSERYESEFAFAEEESIWTKIMNLFAQEKEEKPLMWLLWLIEKQKLVQI